VKNVSVSNPTDSFLLDITYTAGTAAGAAAGANAFAGAYLEQRQKLAQDAATSVDESITAQIADLNKNVTEPNRKIDGLGDRPKEFSLDGLKKMKSTELIFGFECSGNRRPTQGLSGNGRWTGVSLKTVLDQAGAAAEDHRQPDARYDR